jgi:hypothetical protein
MCDVFLSPALPTSIPEEPSCMMGLRLCDRAVITWADQLLVVHVRRSGNVEQLVRMRLSQSRPTAAEVFIAVGPNLVEHNLADELLTSGATEWFVPSPPPENMRVDPAGIADISHSGQIKRLDSLLSNWENGEWNYLTHCTRAPRGAWPDQSESEFLDELLTATRPVDRSPLAALARIVTQERIIASAAALRGQTPAVCFTAVPLAELHRLRVYQPQRQCWDFEPYGICIRQSWLAHQGARPVIYGDDQDWECLSASDRPFFQRRGTRRGVRRRQWTQEKEWRHLGDLNLKRVPADSAFVFVPSRGEAESLAQVSRWPIVICR